MNYFRLILIACLITSATNIANSQISMSEESCLELLSVRKIWSNDAHNAFTDLVFYKGTWYCAFREASSHRSRDGMVRIIISKDLNSWESNKVFSVDGDDFRDPKFSITSQGYLLLNFNQRFLNPKDEHIRQSVTWLTKDGKNWQGPYTCKSGLGTWRWSVTWHRDKGYSVGYTGKDISGTLYTTTDGKEWDPYIKDFYPEIFSYPNETSLVFSNNDSIAYCLLRRDRGSKTAMLGYSYYPYSNWKWNDLGVRIAGPKMIRLHNGDMLAVVRLYDQRERTSVCLIDPVKNILKEIVTLPSGGDNSYGGMVMYEDFIYICYYSSHEERSSIYLAKLKY